MPRLQLVLGRSGSGKSEYALNKMTELGVFNAVLVVPEQFTLETEKGLMDKLHCDAIPDATVTSFSKMATAYLSAFTNGGRYINNFGRCVLMNRALKNQSHALKVYGGKITRSLADAFVSVSAELKTACITSEELFERASEFSDSVIGDKLHDIALVTGEYESLMSGLYEDSLDDLAKLARGIREQGLYKDKTVIFDGFNNFSAQEERVIIAVMEQAREVIVTAPCSGVIAPDDEADSGIFENVREDIRKLLGEAHRLNIDVSPTIRLKENYRGKTKEIKLIESSLFGGNGKCETCEGLELYSVNSASEEAFLLSALIRRDVKNNGLRYRDCAVIARSLKDYSVLIPDAFAKMDIPFYMDTRDDATVKPLFTLILSALAVAAGERREENIFTCLKTGYFDATPDEIYNLENYVLMWNLKNEDIFSKYTLHPRGYEEELTEKDKQILASLNSTREKVFPPLTALVKRLKGKFNGDTFCKAVYSFLLDLKVPSKIDKQSGELREEGSFVYADELVRLWELVIDILDQMSFALSKDELDAVEAYELFTAACEDADIGRIPPVSDGVTVGSADRIRVADVKKVYIIGANEGSFPASSSSQGILTDRDRELLKEKGLPIGGDALYWSVEEMFIAYKAFTCAEQGLSVSFCRSSFTGEKLRPSPLVNMLKELFPSLKETFFEEISPYELSLTKDAALSVVAQSGDREDKRIASVASAIKEFPEYRRVIDTVENEKRASGAKIEREEISSALFGKNMRMSASKLEVYHKCKYAYFMKYGLLLKPRVKMSLRADTAGTFVHYVLENALRELSREDIEALTREHITECVTKWSDIYCEKAMGGKTNKNASFIYILGRLKKLALAVTLNICEEMKQSEFRPAEFELSISENGQVPPYRVECEKGSVNIEGKVDRVDTMMGEENFVRVIDYKTGCKEFKLNDLLYGLNMQMLIYLFAINGGKDYEKHLPGGVLYYPAARRTFTAEIGDSKDKLNEKQESGMRMNGLMLDDIRCIKGMERDLGKKYVPVGVNKNGELTGGVLASQEQMESISRYIDALIYGMHTSLTQGDISAVPIKGTTTDACKYCDYSSVCGRDDITDPENMLVSRKNDEAMLEIERAVKRNEKEGGENNA